MFVLIVCPIFHVVCIQIPRIDHVSLVAVSSTKVITILNSTCDECLCAALVNHSVAVNCFLNNDTCQLFDRVPNRYRIEPGEQAELYFPSGSIPNASQCCMPDLDALLAELYNAYQITVSQSSTRFLALDNHGYLISMNDWGHGITRSIPRNLTVVDQTAVSAYSMRSLAFYDDAYYLGSDTNTIQIVDSNTLATVNLITHPNISGVRDIMFLRDGQTMVVTSTYNQQLFFFNRSSSSPINYTFSYQVTTSYPSPHGLWSVNDSFFYTTSWDSSSVYSHATADGVAWTETLFADTRVETNSSGASNVMIDECERRWITIPDSGMIIYDSGGSFLGRFTPTWSGIFDAILMPDYVMYLSDWTSQQIIRLDPQIQC